MTAETDQAPAMTVEQAVAVLREHNAWRRGADTPMGDPAEIGRAIDVLCCLAEYMLETAKDGR